MKNKIKRVLQGNLLYVFLFIGIIVHLFLSMTVERNSIYQIDDDVFEGTVVKRSVTNNKISFELDGEETLLCSYYSDEADRKEDLWKSIPLGSKVVVKGKLKIPSKNTVPNTFDYRQYLYNKGIYYTCTIEEIEVIDKTMNIFYKIKNAVIDRVMTFKIKDYLYTMIIGDKSLLDDDTFSKYRDNGVTRLFAISGMHVGLFAVIIGKILKKCKIKKKNVDLYVVIFIWFYAFLAGFGASVIRAGLLFTFVAVDKWANWQIPKLKLLFLVGVILVLFDYRMIFDVGFIYSYVTTFGLIYSSKTIEKHKIFGTSLVANLFSLPITIHNFYKFNLASVFFNLLFVPFVSIVIYPLCLLTFFVRWLEPITGLFINGLELLNTICAEVNQFIFIVPKLNAWIFILYYAVLILFIRKSIYKTAVILITLCLLWKVKPLLDSSLHVEFMDVGQGDCAIIRTEHNKKIVLIDTGGIVDSKSNYKVSDNIVTYLHSLGLDRVDSLILTHGDYDHMGEAINLVNNFKVEKVIFNCGEFNDLEQELIKVLAKKKIPYYSCIKELNIDNNKLYFLNNKDYGNENDNSSVIYTELNNHKFLFMGDAGVDVEEDLIEKYNLKNIDALKVGHHGSKTSSSKTFIDEINPKYSVISVGKNNRYGHPNISVLDNLEDSKIYRTDQEGSIMFKIKNNKLEIETCPP